MRATTTRSRRRTVAIGVIAATLTVAGVGGGVALAAPESAAGQVLGAALDELGVEWAGMPENYSKEQYLAFWGAGYQWEDVEALMALWGTDATETKARAGQMVLDGQTLPIAPSTPQDEVADPGPGDPGDGAETAYEAALSAGYTSEDIDALAALWNLDWLEAKARAGQMVIDGQTVPVAPGSTASGN